jgi:hypothetical protein
LKGAHGDAKVFLALFVADEYDDGQGTTVIEEIAGSKERFDGQE